MVPILVGIVLLIIIITVICYVKLKRSSNTAPAEPVPMVAPPPRQQRVLFSSPDSRATVSTGIAGVVTNPTSATEHSLDYR